VSVPRGRPQEVDPVEQRRDQVGEVIRDFRREQVVEAARQLFAERGSVEVSMEEVAARAGVARSTVYKHFANRGEVLQGCLGAAHRKLVDDLDAALAGEAPAADDLATFVRVVLQTVDDNVAFFRIATALHSGAGELGVATQATIGVVGLEVGSILDRILDRAFDAGVLRTDAPARVRALVGQVIFGAASSRVEDPDALPPAEAAAELRDLLLDGLGAGPRGRR
jgi:AcrR family transcriptional regulator